MYGSRAFFFIVVVGSECRSVCLSVCAETEGREWLVSALSPEARSDGRSALLKREKEARRARRLGVEKRELGGCGAE